MADLSRRTFIKNLAAGTAGLIATGSGVPWSGNMAGYSVEVLNPGNRVPVSFIIDDSTALVNMAYYGIPQFKEVFPDQYKQDWKKLPPEIPDDFVREFGEWCRSNGVKGKYSMVPYPACTGWLHRFIPGWSSGELKRSLKLVRDFMMADWDIHPEMISHTRVINTRTGMPYPHATPEYMENWEWSQDKSSDVLANYIAYALNILKEADLPCEGVTTPGGFGSQNMDNLAMGTLEACRDVFQTEIPHFFRDLRTDPGQSVEPELFHVSGLDTDDPRCSVSIIGCTGDWFGGWDGLSPGSADRFITPDLKKGRMVDVIESGQPALMVCHWPGIYYNGTKLGFNIFKTVVKRLHQKYDHLVWMKNSEIARYWACKKLTSFQPSETGVQIKAPFSTSRFTVKINKQVDGARLAHSDGKTSFARVDDPLQLSDNTYYTNRDESIFCFRLPKGESKLVLG